MSKAGWAGLTIKGAFCFQWEEPKQIMYGKQKEQKRKEKFSEKLKVRSANKDIIKTEENINNKKKFTLLKSQINIFCLIPEGSTEASCRKKEERARAEKGRDMSKALSIHHL